MLRRWAVNIRGISKEGIAPSAHVDGPTDKKTTRGLFRVVTIGAGIVAVLSALALFTVTPWLSHYRGLLLPKASVPTPNRLQRKGRATPREENARTETSKSLRCVILPC